MSDAGEQRALEALREFDTPSITNVVGSYPEDPNCLALYDPWEEHWYTDQTIRCMFPELGPRAGRAVTCVFGLPDSSGDMLSLLDILEGLERVKAPTILLIRQEFPPELADRVGLAGGILTAAVKAMGCVGVISNGPSRDVHEIRLMKMQYLLSGTTPAHGQMAVHAVNVPVTIAGMDVVPGEIVHMDENGACKFPAERLGDVLDRVQHLREEEAICFRGLEQAASAAEVRSVLAEHVYGEDVRRR